MNKTLFCSVFVLAAVVFTAQSFNVEARECRRCYPRSNVSVSVGTVAPVRPGYVVQRYARPVPAPVIYAADPYAPVYVAPSYPVYAAPVYVEEVYVAPRPSAFSGLSFSWNFFR